MSVKTKEPSFQPTRSSLKGSFQSKLNSCSSVASSKPSFRNELKIGQKVRQALLELAEKQDRQTQLDERLQKVKKELTLISTQRQEVQSRNCSLEWHIAHQRKKPSQQADNLFQDQMQELNSILSGLAAKIQEARSRKGQYQQEERRLKLLRKKQLVARKDLEKERAVNKTLVGRTQSSDSSSKQ